jgi:hypothetical protein
MAPLIGSRDSLHEKGPPYQSRSTNDFVSLEINGAESTAAVRVDHPMAHDGLAQAPDPQRGNHGGHAR